MATPKRRLTRDESKARTRSELLRAASRLFVRNGYVATSLTDIAEEAALTKGAVYSNFASKEDLFLALLQQRSWAGDEFSEDTLAPANLAGATGETPGQRAGNWGRAVSAIRRNRRNVALFFEMNAAALRSDRTRAWVAAHNTGFFQALGRRLADKLQVEEPDEREAEVLGLVAQSLYVGLMMHEAFNATAFGPDTYEQAYRLLAHLAHERAPDPT